MKATILVLALALAATSLALVPSAQAADSPCLVGDTTCFVGIEWYVCVTEPCDAPRVCVNYGAICVRLGLP